MTMTSHVHAMGVLDLSEAIATKRLSPVEVCAAFIARIDRYDEQVRAWSFIEHESIMYEARILTEEASSGRLRGPLHGVPFAVKEQFALAGAPTLRDWSDPNPSIAAADATVVTRLKAAGTLVFGKTFMASRIGMPPTRNPWNLEYSPGGSSSGSGAVVGARFVPFALSEQTGGSGIRPAAYNGVSGFKPTFGRNSRAGMFPLSYSQDHACIIATSVADLIPVFSVIAGSDPHDVTSRSDGAWKDEVSLARPPKIGIVRNFFPEMTESEMQACIEDAGRKLAAAGADVIDFQLPDEMKVAWANAEIICTCEGAVINAVQIANAAGNQRRGAVTQAPVAKFTNFPISISQLIPTAYYLQAQRVRRYLRDVVDEKLSAGGFDAILMATAPGAAPRDNGHSGDPSLCVPWSHLSNPAVNIPGGLNAAGMPLGLQFVGQTMSDERLLSVCVWCQRVLGVLPPPDLARILASSPASPAPRR